MDAETSSLATKERLESELERRRDLKSNEEALITQRNAVKADYEASVKQMEGLDALFKQYIQSSMDLQSKFGLNITQERLFEETLLQLSIPLQTLANSFKQEGVIVDLPVLTPSLKENQIKLTIPVNDSKMTIGLEHNQEDKKINIYLLDSGFKYLDEKHVLAVTPMSDDRVIWADRIAGLGEDSDDDIQLLSISEIIASLKDRFEKAKGFEKVVSRLQKSDDTRIRDVKKGEYV